MRMIALACGLTEELKWGTPCYVFQKSKIVLIHVFKEYCAFLFFKGALLSNADGLLIEQSANTQATKQIRFTNVADIINNQTILKATIYEAIEIEKAGLKVEFKKTEAFEVAEEFQNKLTEISALKIAFEKLTPGRQRAYLLYFSAPKQSKTRIARIEKCIPLIFNGKGLNEL